jgi:hypothetical protein
MVEQSSFFFFFLPAGPALVLDGLCWNMQSFVSKPFVFLLSFYHQLSSVLLGLLLPGNWEERVRVRG